MSGLFEIVSGLMLVVGVMSIFNRAGRPCSAVVGVTLILASILCVVTQTWWTVALGLAVAVACRVVGPSAARA
ncbi:MAG: hypothetical protein AB7Q00_13035 [Phycisphaerales bacterium]